MTSSLNYIELVFINVVTNMHIHKESPNSGRAMFPKEKLLYKTITTLRVGCSEFGPNFLMLFRESRPISVQLKDHQYHFYVSVQNPSDRGSVGKCFKSLGCQRDIFICQHLDKGGGCPLSLSIVLGVWRMRRWVWGKVLETQGPALQQVELGFENHYVYRSRISQMFGLERKVK